MVRDKVRAYTRPEGLGGPGGARVGHDHVNHKSADSARCLPIVYPCKLSSRLSPTNYL